MVVQKSKLILVAAVVLLSISGGCFWQRDSKIILLNRSSSIINVVQVQVSDKVFEARNIQPSKVQTWQFRPDRDSSFKVTGRLSTGESINGTSLGYTTSGDSQEHYLIVRKAGAVVYGIDRDK